MRVRLNVSRDQRKKRFQTTSKKSSIGSNDDDDDDDGTQLEGWDRENEKRG